MNDITMGMFYYELIKMLIGICLTVVLFGVIFAYKLYENNRSKNKR